MSSQTIDERIDELLVSFFNEAEVDVHSDNFNSGRVITKAGARAKQAIKALILEAEMAGMLQVQALLEDDPNPDAVRPLSSSQLRKLHEYIKQQLKGGE